MNIMIKEKTEVKNFSQGKKQKGQQQKWQLERKIKAQQISRNMWIM